MMATPLPDSPPRPEVEVLLSPREDTLESEFQVDPVPV